MVKNTNACGGQTRTKEGIFAPTAAGEDGGEGAVDHVLMLSDQVAVDLVAVRNDVVHNALKAPKEGNEVIRT